MGHSSLVLAIAGIAFFLFGMGFASDNLQKLAANRIRDLLTTLGDRPLWGVVVGILMTVVIQSSGAVMSLLVGLGSAGVVTLRQVMGIIIGAAIGTTFTVQLLSLNISKYGLPLFAFSFIVYFISKKRVVRRVMSVFMGFGLLFWGLDLIGVATSDLRDARFFVDFLDYLKANPLVTVLVTSVFTAVVHSSAATIGFSMSLATTGLISLSDAIYWVYGANIGTTATALMASTGGNYVGRQVAWAHFLFKIISVGIFYFATDFFAHLIDLDSIQRNVANAHTAYNIISAILFFPFIHIGARVVEKMFPPLDSEKEFSTKFLERGTYESPSVVMAHAEREVLRMGDIVYSMVRDSLKLFEREDPDLFEKIKKRDNRVDLLNKEISLYLTSFIENSESLLQGQVIQIVSFAADLESAADVVDNSLIELANKKHALKLEFTKEAWEGLRHLHKLVVEEVELSLSAFQRRDTELASKVIYLKREVRKVEKALREGHFSRLIEGRRESINTSSIHLDVLHEYRRIAGLAANHVYGVLKDNDPYNIMPRREPNQT